MTDYKFDIILHPWGVNPDRGIVGIDTAALYGYWERKDGSEGGGLWFLPLCDAPIASAGGFVAGKSVQGSPLELIDYDGAFELPRSVVVALRAAGYVLDETFDA
jgi:hypothetical protein